MSLRWRFEGWSTPRSSVSRLFQSASLLDATVADSIISARCVPAEDVDLELHVHGRITAPPPEMDDVEAPAPGPLEIIPAEVRREDRDEALAEVQGSDSIGVSENALALQKALQAAGKDGLKWNQLLVSRLYQHTKSFRPSGPLAERADVLTSLMSFTSTQTLPDVTAPLDCTTIIALARAFSTSSPPLAFWAGYDEARLVSSAFIRGWTCVIPPIEMSRGARARAVRDAREASEQEKMDEDENPDPSRAGSREAGSVPAEEKEAPHEKEQVGEQMLLYPKKWLSLEGEVIEPEWERSVRCVIGWIMARPTSEVCDSHPSLPHLALALPHLTYALLLPPFLSLSSPSATTSPRPSTARNSPISSASFSKKASSVARSSSIPPRPTSAACSRRRIAPTLERSGGCRGSRRRGVCGRSCRGGGWRGLSSGSAGTKVRRVCLSLFLSLSVLGSSLSFFLSLAHRDAQLDSIFLWYS